MILAALALSLPCSKPLIEPQAGHGLYVHIRRLKDVCLPEIETPGLVAMSEPETFEGETPYPMPTEGIWAMPSSEPYCACIDETHGQSGGYPTIPGFVGYVGGSYFVPIAYPNIPAVPEPAEWLLMVAGLGLLARRKLWTRN